MLAHIVVVLLKFFQPTKKNNPVIEWQQLVTKDKDETS